MIAMRLQIVFKKSIYFILLSSVLLLSGCLKDKFTRTYTLLYPVYATKSEVLASINSEPISTVKNPGKFYLYGKYIFLNEIDKGVHVIDNSNPSKPKPVAFLKIPGNLDIAVRGSIMYADMYGDLLTLDISNPTKASLKKLVPDVFPQRVFANGYQPEAGKVIVDWIRKDTTVDVEKTNPNILWFGCATCNFALANASDNKTSGSVPGIAGSMARMSIVGDYLYAVNHSDLISINIVNPSSPQTEQTQSVGWNIETIFPFKDKLFIGSASGMFIFSIGNPAQPLLEGSFSHARACDPVVADDNYAYVTLRSGTFCEGFNNQLDIVDVANVSAPKLVRTYSMTNPHGLAKDGNLLFLCDGADGLKIYDVSSVNNIKLLHHLKNIETYDAIAWNKNLMVVCKDGLIQIDYSDIKNIRQISKINVSRD